MSLVFRRTNAWALLPFKVRVSRAHADEDAAVYSEYFRWIRKLRAPERCWPWRLGHEVGWRIPSPVDITMGPAPNLAVAMPEPEVEFFGEQTGLTDVRRVQEGRYLASQRVPWTTLYEVKFGDELENMFQPLGDGWYGWRLGWDAILPQDAYLLVLPTAEIPGVDVAPGLIGPSGVTQIASAVTSDPRFGVTLAIRPKQEVEIARRQSIARIVVLSAESMAMEATLELEAGSALDVKPSSE